MLRLRLVTGPLLIVLLLALVWLDMVLDVRLAETAADRFEGWAGLPRGLLLLSFAVVVIIPLAAVELHRILAANGLPGRAWLTVVAAETALLATCIGIYGPPWTVLPALLPTALGVLMVLAMVVLSRGQRIEGVAAGAGGLLLAAVYLGVLPAFLIAIRQSWSGWVLIGVVLTIKSCDIGAYFTGHAVGRTKLIPWLSPGKTREGLVGGVVAAAAVGGGLSLLAGPRTGDPTIPLWVGVCGGAVLGVVGQGGDLVESLLKRGGAVKDSGRALPGMGGVLDVLDSLILGAPVAWWILQLAR